MEGGELFDRVCRRPFTEREAAKTILMIARAVAHLHHMDMVKKKKESSVSHLNFLSFDRLIVSNFYLF